MKKCCEYCKHCDEDYETICVLCRVDGGKVDFSKFELNDELAELERLGRLGKAIEKLSEENNFRINWSDSADYLKCCYTLKYVIDWAESEGE